MNYSQQNSNNEQSLTIHKVITYLQGIQADDMNETVKLDKELSLLKITNEQLQKKYQYLLTQQSTIQEDFHTLSSILNRAQQYISEPPVTTQLSPMAPIFEIDQNGQINIIEAQ